MLYDMKQDAMFEDDLKFVANKVSDALNIFNETVVADNKLVTLYGNEEFIALIMTPYENRPKFGSLRLRTRDMAATWDNVPVGFSEINESRGLLADMKRAAKVSLKRNSIWYIDQQIKDIVGDRIVFTELTTNKGYLYKLAFTNGFTVYLSITKDDKLYHLPHDIAPIYFLADHEKNPISEPMTADACMLMLANIAMQVDLRAAKFISLAEQHGGKTTIAHVYRTQDSSLDEVKAVFSNGFAMKLYIENDEIAIDLYGKYDNKMIPLDSRKFKDIEIAYQTIGEVASLPFFDPSEAIQNKN